MRANLARFEMITPRNLKGALKLIGEGCLPFAGGTDLMVLIESGKLPPIRLVNLAGIEGLGGGVRVGRDGSIEIGALTVFKDIADHSRICRDFPALAEAARQVGAWAIQNRATIAGNLANASPAADSSPALLAYGADLVIVGSSGGGNPRGQYRRLVPYRCFHTGYKKTELRPGELIAAIRLSSPQRSNSKRTRGRGADERVVHYFRKVGTRRAQAISKVSLAGVAVIAGGEIRSVGLGLGAVGPMPVRPLETERVLVGSRIGDPAARARAIDCLSGEISPMDDLRSTREYRAEVARRLLGEFLGRIGSR